MIARRLIALVLVLEILGGFLSSTGAAVVYEDPAGWRLVVEEQISYTEIVEWMDHQGSVDYLGKVLGRRPGYALHRRMAEEPADYYRAVLIVDCPSSLVFMPGDRFVFYSDAGDAASSVRLLFVDGLGLDQFETFDSSRERVPVCQLEALQWVKRDGDRGLPVAVHFPWSSTRGLEHIQRIEFARGGE
jgi:hypothetical protein